MKPPTIHIWTNQRLDATINLGARGSTTLGNLGVMVYDGLK